jgi:hypothetical protein
VSEFVRHGDWADAGLSGACWESPKAILYVATLGNDQGPVYAATRTAQFIVLKKLTHLGMVGICGGKYLGSVQVCDEAISFEAGRVQLSDRPEFPLIPHQQYQVPDAKPNLLYRLVNRKMDMMGDATTYLARKVGISALLPKEFEAWREHSGIQECKGSFQVYYQSRFLSFNEVSHSVVSQPNSARFSPPLTLFFFPCRF